MITTINNSDSNSKLCNIVFNLECENEPQLPAEHYVNVFKTKLIGNNYGIVIVISNLDEFYLIFIICFHMLQIFAKQSLLLKILINIFQNYY